MFKHWLIYYLKSFHSQIVEKCIWKISAKCKMICIGKCLCPEMNCSLNLHNMDFVFQCRARLSMAVSMSKRKPLETDKTKAEQLPRLSDKKENWYDSFGRKFLFEISWAFFSLALDFNPFKVYTNSMGWINNWITNRSTIQTKQCNVCIARARSHWFIESKETKW